LLFPPGDSGRVGDAAFDGVGDSRGDSADLLEAVGVSTVAGFVLVEVEFAGVRESSGGRGLDSLAGPGWTLVTGGLEESGAGIDVALPVAS
jgi:hypothetical protein